MGDELLNPVVSGANASGVPAATEVPAPTVPGSDVAPVAPVAPEVVDELIPRSVMEAQLDQQGRHWQSVIDKRFDDMQKQITPHVNQLPQSMTPTPMQNSVTPQAPAEASEFDNDKFMTMLDEDPAKARNYFFANNSQPQQNPLDIQNAVSQAVTQALTLKDQNEQQMGQFVDSIHQATNGMTGEEKQRAEQYAVSSYQNTGQFVDPHMAAMVGRYGNVQEAMKMANAQMTAMGQPLDGGVPTTPPNNLPPVISGPGLVGGGLGQTPVNQGELPSNIVKPGSFRSLLKK